MSKESANVESIMKTSNSRFDFRYAIWTVFSLTIFSGLFLMVYYIPQFGQAFSSVERLNEQVPFGWMIRRIHGAGGNILLILLLLHFLQIFYLGDYKAGRPAAWMIGIIALICTVWVNFSGFFLPISQSSFWGTATVLSSFSAIPWAGSFAVDFIRGGKELGGAALLRFYSMHVGFSALIAFLLLWYHRVESAGELGVKTDRQRSRGILIATILVGLLLAAITFVPDWFTDSLKETANPMANPERIFLPWYFLFLEETLKFLVGAYPFWSMAAIVIFSLSIFFLPFIDRNPERSLLLRPLPMGLGAAFLAVVVYFSLLGAANARYGEKIIIPDRPLSTFEIRGAKVYAGKNCAYCHQVFGQEGRREGPDMAVITERRRSPEWVQRFTLNARLFQPGTTMPRYEISIDDLEALAAYLLSLDSSKERFKAVERKQFMD